jgi:hypothetical protein
MLEILFCQGIGTAHRTDSMAGKCLPYHLRGKSRPKYQTHLTNPFSFRKCAASLLNE